MFSASILLQILVGASLRAGTDQGRADWSSQCRIGTEVAKSAPRVRLCTACALYNNWWPMLSGETGYYKLVMLVIHWVGFMVDNVNLLLLTALMYVLVPMPCLFFGGGSTQFLISRDGGGWIDAAKFLTGASAVGSFAIPIILRHAHMISTGAMFIEFTSFIIFVCTVLCFHRASLEDDW
ncbi:hypothetical protein POUND7_001589 [Theobroma cacao]